MVECMDSSWTKRDFPNEYGSIGEKMAKEWLLENGYEVYPFQEIMWKFSDLRVVTNRLRRRRKQAYVESDRELIYRIESILANIFGEKLKDMEMCCEALRNLERKEEEIRLARHYKRVGVCPDFVVRKDGDTFFIEVKVNQSQPKKHQRTAFRIAKEHRFKTMILRLNVQILIQKDIHLAEL